MRRYFPGPAKYIDILPHFAIIDSKFESPVSLHGRKFFLEVYEPHSLMARDGILFATWGEEAGEDHEYCCDR
jgi:hypothetical protein